MPCGFSPWVSTPLIVLRRYGAHWPRASRHVWLQLLEPRNESSSLGQSLMCLLQWSGHRCWGRVSLCRLFCDRTNIPLSREFPVCVSLWHDNAGGGKSSHCLDNCFHSEEQHQRGSSELLSLYLRTLIRDGFSAVLSTPALIQPSSRTWAQSDGPWTLSNFSKHGFINSSLFGSKLDCVESCRIKPWYLEQSSSSRAESRRIFK